VHAARRGGYTAEPDVPAAGRELGLAEGAKAVHGGEVYLQHGGEIGRAKLRLQPDGARAIDEVMQFAAVVDKFCDRLGICHIEFDGANVFVRRLARVQPHGNHPRALRR
jgi:hypothetical protein